MPPILVNFSAPILVNISAHVCIVHCILLSRLASQMVCFLSEHFVGVSPHCVGQWIERLVGSAESTGSSLFRDSYCLGTLCKSFALNCSAMPLLLRPGGVCLHFWTQLFYCIVYNSRLPSSLITHKVQLYDSCCSSSMPPLHQSLPLIIL